MALHVMHKVRNTPNFNNIEEHTWHVGESTTLNMPFPRDIVHIQADGDELEHIHRRFSVWIAELDKYIPTIPFPDLRIVTWVGDVARTIVANL